MILIDGSEMGNAHVGNIKGTESLGVDVPRVFRGVIE